jgi:hypothetical protein
MKPLGWAICLGVDRSGLWLDLISYEEARFYQDELIQCQSDHGNYACSHGGVAMSDSDGMDSSTQVPVVRCAWAPMVTSCHVLY